MASIKCEHPQEVVKEAFFLAWQACGGPSGYGFMQNKPGAAKGDVWNCAFEAQDYPGGNLFKGNKPGKCYGDYVFGRMMKLGLEWDADSVKFRDDAPQHDYQGWCRKYPSYQVLVEAAIASVNANTPAKAG